MRRPAIVATLPFRFRFFFQAALDGVRPPKPVFMILDLRYLDPKTPYSFKKVFGQHPHLLKSFLNALLPLEPDAQTELLESLPSNLVPSVPLVRKKGHLCRHFHHYRYRIHQEWI